jgi:hypothetical protein
VDHPARVVIKGDFGGSPAKISFNSSGLIPASPAWMTAEAFSGNIEDALFSMVFFGFCLVVAPVAVHRGVRTLVTARAVSAGPAMVHWEGMPLDTDRAPIAGVMALRALPAPVTAWRGMARRTIGLA